MFQLLWLTCPSSYRAGVWTGAMTLGHGTNIPGFLDHGRNNEHSDLMGKSWDSWVKTPKETRETIGTVNLWGWAAPSQAWLGHGSLRSESWRLWTSNRSELVSVVLHGFFQPSKEGGVISASMPSTSAHGAEW